jgi:hypothetical protein
MTTKKINPPVHYTKETLQQEQRRLRLVIKEQEAAIRQRVQKLPGELFYASVDAVVPTVLSGKITNSVLNAGKNFINKSVVKKTSGNTSKLVTAAKQAGVFTLLKVAYNVFIRRKD